MNKHRTIPLGALTALLFGVSLTALGATVPEAALQQALRETLKGGSELAPAPELPQTALGLAPGESPAASPPCRTPTSQLPLVLGGRDQYAKLGGAAIGLLGRLLSSATNGQVQPAGSQKTEYQPPLYKDPIEHKTRMAVKDKPSGVHLDLGGRVASDGVLLSTRIDSAHGEGTFHEIYLERDDCHRIFPFADFTYELWGHWHLSVSWTQTTSNYQDGKLLNQQQSSGGFSRSGDMSSLPDLSAAFGTALKEVPPELRGGFADYQRAVSDMIGTPLWQRLGFKAPISGARTVGTMFRLGPGDLEALRAGRFRAIVQVTREHGPLYDAQSVPVALAAGKGDALAFEAVPPLPATRH